MPEDYETLGKRQRIANTLQNTDYQLIHSLGQNQTPARVRANLREQLIRTSTACAVPGSKYSSEITRQQ
jgi:vacuolar-type H+-ATPase subunit C/Vma6